MADKDLDKELEDLKKVSEEYRRMIEQYIEANKALLGGEKKAKEGALAFVKAYDDSTKKVKKSAETLSGEMDALTKAYDDGLKTTEELNEELESLRRQVNKTTDQSKKDQLIAKKAVLEEISLRNQSRESLKDSFGQLAGVMSVGVASAFKNIAVTALSSGDGIATAGAAMSAGVDLANKTVQVGANSMKDVGGMMSQMGGKAKIAGVGLTVLGSVVGGVADGLSDLAKAGIQFMIKETQKSIETFRTMSQSGAMFADGAVGMRLAATDAGMTLKDFSKVTTQNKEIFAKMGMGVSGGTQRLAGAMKAGGEQMQNELFALGYSMEDQGNLMAQTMAAMSDPTGKLKASNEEVAQRAKKYAQDLAMLSALTGEDMKAKQEKIKAENLELAVAQKLAKMDPKQKAEFEAMQQTLNETQRRQLKERMVYGTVISADLAVMEATSSNLKQQGDEVYQAYKDGTASAEKGMQLRSKYDEKIAKDALGNESLAAAGMAGVGGPAGEAVKAFGTLVSEGNKFTEEGIKETKRILEERKSQASTDPMVGVQKAANNFEKQLETLASENLKGFGDALKTTMNLITDSVTAANKALKGTEMPSPWIAGLMTLGTTLLQFLPALLSALKGGGGGPELPDGKDGKGKPKGGKPGGGIMSKLNSVKSVTKGLGVAGTLISGAMLASDLSDIEEKKKKGEITEAEAKKQKGTAVGSTVGGAGGAWAGAAAGAAIGSVVPVVGTVVGGLIGAAVGGWLGSKGGEMVGEAVMTTPAGKAAAPGVKAAAEGTPTTKGGAVAGATNAPANTVTSMPTGYQANTPQAPKVEAPVTVKEVQAKFDSTISQFGTQMKDSNKHGPEMIQVLRSQIAKQDEVIAVMKESLDINQRLLTQAQG